MAKPTTIDPLTQRDVADYESHSEEGIRALISILASHIRNPKPRKIIEGVLDRIERLDEDYRKIAHELAPEDRFPERAQRWPGLFAQPQPPRQEELEMTQADESKLAEPDKTDVTKKGNADGSVTG